MALSVSVQPRNSGFVKLGNKHRYGVVPESIVYSADLNEFGCLNATFLLKINPQYNHYDIEHFTPVVIRDGSTDVWSGRIIGTPTEYGDTGIVHVECHGWGQHLKDDATDYEWAIDDLSRFYSTPSSLDSAIIPTGYQAETMQNEDGALVLPCPQGTTMVQNRACSATIDLGRNVRAKRIVAKFKAVTQPGSNNFAVYIRASDSPEAPAVAGVSQSITYNPPDTSTTVAFTATTGTRYLHVFWWYAGPTTQAGYDHSIKFEFIRIFADTADESGNASVLKASTIISEVMDLLCPNFNSSRARIQATSFNIPNFPGKPGFKFGSELVESANAFHGWKFLLTPNASPVPVFEPQDSVHTFVVGNRDDYRFSDPSRNDGRNVFSRVISEYTGTDGRPDYAEATGSTWGRGDAGISDGGFESTMTTWNFYTGPSPASTEKVTSPTPQSGTYCLRIQIGNILTGSIGGTKAGKKYRVSFYARTTSTSQNIVFASSPTSPQYTSPFLITTTWTLCQVELTATTGTQWAPFGGNTSFAVYGLGASENLYVDSFYVEEVTGNVVNRRGFQRTALRPINARSTAEAASALATIDISELQYPPLKGKLEMTGVMRTVTNDTVPVTRIPSAVGKIVLLEQLRDPNTGAIGRKAPIRQAEYAEDEDKVTIDLDDSNDFISNLKNRIL